METLERISARTCFEIVEGIRIQSNSNCRGTLAAAQGPGSVSPSAAPDPAHQLPRPSFLVFSIYFLLAYSSLRPWHNLASPACFLCVWFVVFSQNILYDLNSKLPQGENLIFSLNHLQPSHTKFYKLPYQPLASLQISSNTLLWPINKDERDGPQDMRVAIFTEGTW